jgi:hypothetical protein
MPTPVSRGFRRGQTGLVLLGVDLKDAREEVFVRMVCDGLALGIAYARAGFKSKAHDAPYLLFHLPRIQERAAAILEARRTQGVVTLPEVTDMLKRVFAGAHAAEEYSAAHNAAFSLARLYGHVTDKATLEVIRRPSRDPDAPSEQVLSDWVASLPVVSGPFSDRLEGPQDPQLGPTHGAPAAPLGPGPSVEGPMLSADNIEGPGPELTAVNSGTLLNDINDLTEPGPGDGRAGTENGAPSSPVTGTPRNGAHSGLLVPSLVENGSPFADQGTVYPSAEELFG